MQTRSKINLTNTNIKSLLLPFKTRAKTYKICIFDTESFSSPLQVPIQVAWGIYEINGKKIKLIKSEMFYITEMWVLKDFRSQIHESKYFTDKTRKKHENHMKKHNYPLIKAKEFIEKFKDDLQNCKYIAAFNIEWDVKAIDNLIKELKLNSTKNPMNSIEQLDIMHMAYRTFSNKLIKNGVNNGIINKRGFKSNRKKKGICSAENMAKVLLGKKNIQNHLADTDVELEKELLEVCLQKNGSLIYKKITSPIWKSIQANTKDIFPKKNLVNSSQ
jgi:hypothetical protein